MKRTVIPHFATKKELFAFLKKNHDVLLVEKKAVLKHGDGIPFIGKSFFDPDKEGANKAMLNDPSILMVRDRIGVKVVINTTNLMDSFSDVHIPGLWKKSLSTNKLLMHVQEHTLTFDHIIADGAELKATTEMMSWKSLGYNFKGETEALVFESIILKERNPFMFKTYGNGRVKNHSVGMRYISLVMCINDPEYGAEYEAWQKYFPIVANADAAENQGYFWAVKEARAVEGSAVPIGANFATPTLDVSTDKEDSEQQSHSDSGQAKSTPINYDYLLERF